jgi:hypothetical protein
VYCKESAGASVSKNWIKGGTGPENHRPAMDSLNEVMGGLFECGGECPDFDSNLNLEI